MQGSLSRQIGSHTSAIEWFAPGPLDQLTGGYLYDRRIVDGLRRQGHDVRVFNLQQRTWPLDPRAALRLLRALQRQQWDIAVVDELAHPAMALGLPIARRAIAGRPIVALVHHLRASEPGHPAIRRLAALAERAALSRVDAVICNSETTACSLGSFLRPGVAISVVTPGVDARLPGTGGNRRLAHEATLRVLMVAHWTPRKGILEALRAIALCPPTVTLSLVGDPDRDPHYARLVQAELRQPALRERVQVHGLVSPERLASLYSDADALLLASSHEGYGMVLAEALVNGLPIVATRVGAVPEVVRHGLEADLVTAGDVDALARAVVRLASDPAERDRRRTYALERAASLPTWDDASTEFHKVLFDLVARTDERSESAGVSVGRRDVRV